MDKLDILLRMTLKGKWSDFFPNVEKMLSFQIMQ